MQKTADGLKEGVQKSVFSNVSGIGRARSTDMRALGLYLM